MNLVPVALVLVVLWALCHGSWFLALFLGVILVCGVGRRELFGPGECRHTPPSTTGKAEHSAKWRKRKEEEDERKRGEFFD